MEIGLFLVSLGVLAVLARRNLLGVIIGMQLMFMGISLVFVLSGLQSGKSTIGEVAALLAIVVSTAVTSLGVTVYSRLFVLNGNVYASSIQNLKH